MLSILAEITCIRGLTVTRRVFITIKITIKVGISISLLLGLKYSYSLSYNSSYLVYLGL